MKTFHSSGTASGNVERMWRWKMIIPATAIVPIVPPWETSRISGRVNSVTVPRWAAKAPAEEGSRSLGWSRYRRRFAARHRFHGVLLIITVTTNGKWWLSFDDAAPHQMQMKISWQATIMLPSGKRKTIIRLP